ncbi:MAG: hypothetical protein FWD13_03920 [Treponema sp.]|nr:hypothetical protein [Treponema sp.]
MKKALFLSVLLTLAVSSFASELPNRTLYFEGTARDLDQITFFMNNFKMEAMSMGFRVSDFRHEAGFTFRFEIQPYSDEYEPQIKFIILISLIYNETNMEMASFGWPFGELEEMFEHNQFLFYRAASLIPAVTDEVIEEMVQAASAEAVAKAAAGDGAWRNKFLYLRASFDMPISFYALQDTGLVGGGQSVYVEGPDGPESLIPLDHRIMPLPGLTLGAEWQFLTFFSIEANFRVFMADPWKPSINLAVGAELKFPLNLFSNFTIVPYAAFTYPFLSGLLPSFERFPPFFVGGGAYVNIRGHESQSFFLNLNFMTSFWDAYRKNPYGNYAPEPAEIHYKHFTIGISVGYRYGFLTRRRLDFRSLAMSLFNLVEAEPSE